MWVFGKFWLHQTAIWFHNILLPDPDWPVIKYKPLVWEVHFTNPAWSSQRQLKISGLGGGNSREIAVSWIISVESIRDVEPISEAYNHLVRQEKTKTLIRTLIENYISFNSLGADVIADKGRCSCWSVAHYLRRTGEGLLILLSGPPGTGKTLLAEAGKLLG